MKRNGKRFGLAVLLTAVLLAACGKQKSMEFSPAVQQTLPETGVQIAFDRDPQQPVFQQDFYDDESTVDELPYYDFLHCPVLSVSGAAADEVVIAYVDPTDHGYQFRGPILPIPKVDYVEGTGADGTLYYDFDTIYNYLVTVTKDGRNDRFVILCREPG